MNAPYPITLVILLLSYSVQAQDQRTIDSLNSVIEIAEHDTSVCDAYLSWGEKVYLSNPDTALILWQQAINLANYHFQSNVTEANKQKYLTILASGLNNVGFIYERQGDIAKGLEYYHESLKIEEALENKKGMATSLNNIAMLYESQEDLNIALEYHQQSLKILQELGEQRMVAISMNNIASIYEDQIDYDTDSIKRSEYISKALDYYLGSLTLLEVSGKKAEVANSLNNIGYMYYNHGDTAKGLDYHLRSMKMRDEAGDKHGLSMSLHNVGKIYLERGHVAKAKDLAQKSMALAVEIEYPRNIRDAAKLLYNIAKKEANYKEALEMYELHIQMRDSINNEKTQKATIRQQTKYEFEKAQLVKEHDAKEAQRILDEATARRDNLQYSVVLICLLVIGVVVAMLGRLSLPIRMAEGIIFFSFLILFEFLLVLADPYIEAWSGGAPGFKLLFNAGIAALIFPAHAFFEAKLKRRLVKIQ